MMYDMIDPTPEQQAVLSVVTAMVDHALADLDDQGLKLVREIVVAEATSLKSFKIVEEVEDYFAPDEEATRLRNEIVSRCTGRAYGEYPGLTSRSDDERNKARGGESGIASLSDPNIDVGAPKRHQPTIPYNMAQKEARKKAEREAKEAAGKKEQQLRTQRKAEEERAEKDRRDGVAGVSVCGCPGGRATIEEHEQAIAAFKARQQRKALLAQKEKATAAEEEERRNALMQIC
ncbi:hypothetical protein LTR85_009384 [Meristemomyces frigidus]|nr:hypothetical protein LTR85_009384 [Meristemomyces frigidus]